MYTVFYILSNNIT